MNRVSTRINLTPFLVALALLGQPGHAATVYRWVDENGVIHITTEKPPPGMRAERLDLPTARQAPPATEGTTAAPQAGTVSPQRAAERAAVLDSLKNRECVVALEALDRKTSATEPTSAAELKRLNQTVASNCSSNPELRREQEEMAARLRVANGPTCTEARTRLSHMLDGSAEAVKGDVRAQQQFVDEYCTPPVR